MEITVNMKDTNEVGDDELNFIPGHRSTHNVTVIKNTDAIISGG